MTFAEYSQIMREHGIGELCFQYTGKHCSIFCVLHNLNLRYTIYYEKEKAWFDNLDDLFKTKEHSGVNVGLFIYGLDENDFKDRTIVDNVEIGQLIRAYITNYRK